MSVYKDTIKPPRNWPEIQDVTVYTDYLSDIFHILTHRDSFCAVEYGGDFLGFTVYLN